MMATAALQPDQPSLRELMDNVNAADLARSECTDAQWNYFNDVHYHAERVLKFRLAEVTGLSLADLHELGGLL